MLGYGSKLDWFMVGTPMPTVKNQPHLKIIGLFLEIITK
jgi:hypothetical protein